VNTRKVHEIWVEQCDATNEIKLRYGVKAAFDYLVAEKLLNFADAATGRPEFARELPRFVAYVRGLFTPQERLFAGGRWIRTIGPRHERAGFVAEGELRDRTGAAKKGCFLCGTDGSNPSPSSAESAANFVFGRGAWKGRRRRQGTIPTVGDAGARGTPLWWVSSSARGAYQRPAC
jgi:hypothetical protein